MNRLHKHRLEAAKEIESPVASPAAWTSNRLASRLVCNSTR
jgi:hypothetical protein